MRRRWYGRRARVALAALVLTAAVQRMWNAWTLPPLRGYDAPGHAGYILTIKEEHRLPHPLEGWSTFHPPLYYIVGAAVWSALEPLGRRAVLAGLRALGALASLAAGPVAFGIASELGAAAGVALIAAALVLFVPVSQMAADMVGNEALGAALAALALPPILALQARPGDLRAAARAGLLTGLALATKFTGILAAVACAVPFLRARAERRSRSAFALCFLIVALVAGPVYLRNVLLVGSPLPMTRKLQPMRGAERSFVLRPRRILDYLWVSPACLLRPSIFHVAGRPGAVGNRNPAMTSVWGLAYASTWYDAFAHRIPLRAHRDGVLAGPLLAFLGLAPSAMVLLGFAAAALDLVRHRGRSPDAPLVVMAAVGLALFVAFTWRAPAMVAVKASYLLPLAVPAAAFFVRGIALLPRRAAVAATAASAVAALVAGLVFTNGVVFWSEPLGARGVAMWRGFAARLPSSHIGQALSLLVEAGAGR